MRTIGRIAAGKLAVGVGLGVALAGFAGCGGDGGNVVSAPCEFNDGEPNNAPGQATFTMAGAGFDGCLSSTDVDHLTLGAPADPAGGYVQATITPSGGARVQVRVLDADGNELGTFTGDAPDAPLSFFVAVAPGRDPKIAVSDDGAATAPYTYQLISSYVPVPDSYEPNDSAEAATSMTSGSTIEAFMFAGASDAPAAYEDHYRFSAIPEGVTIKLEDVPTNTAARVFLFRPDGSEVARVSSGQRGGALTMVTPVPLAAGDHLIRISLWDEPPAAVGQGTVPDHFTRRYRLTVMQP
jgi:hypothetical protein